ncbi:hypothetical protein ACQP3D_30055, partial [Escherichia coli]
MISTCQMKRKIEKGCTLEADLHSGEAKNTSCQGGVLCKQEQWSLAALTESKVEITVKKGNLPIKTSLF